jgi:CHAT domain-containing protein
VATAVTGLSACATARPTDPNVADEAIHLTAACIRAGLTHVIGTLWEVNDQAAAKLTQNVYTRLRTESGDLDLDRVPAALHQATIELRNRYPRSPLIWAAHVHLGP